MEGNQKSRPNLKVMTPGKVSPVVKQKVQAEIVTGTVKGMSLNSQITGQFIAFGKSEAIQKYLLTVFD